MPGIPPEEHKDGEFAAETTEGPQENEMEPGMFVDFPTEAEVPDSAEAPESLETGSEDTVDPPAGTAENPVEDIPEETGGVVPEAAAPTPPQSDRQSLPKSTAAERFAIFRMALSVCAATPASMSIPAQAVRVFNPGECRALLFR